MPQQLLHPFCLLLFMCNLILHLHPLLCSSYPRLSVGRDSLAGIATCHGLDCLGIESRWGEIFCTFPDRPQGPRTISSAEVKVRVELYLFSLWAFIVCSRVNLAFLFFFTFSFLYPSSFRTLRIVVVNMRLDFIGRIMHYAPAADAMNTFKHHYAHYAHYAHYSHHQELTTIALATTQAIWFSSCCWLEVKCRQDV